MIATQVAVLLARYQPGRALSSIEVSAGLPATRLTQWVDQTTPSRPAAPVSVNTMRRVAAATIDVRVDDGTEHRENAETEGQICDLSGGCRCSTPLRL